MPLEEHRRRLVALPERGNVLEGGRIGAERRRADVAGEGAAVVNGARHVADLAAAFASEDVVGHGL